MQRVSDWARIRSLGLEWVILLPPYNEVWRQQCKLFHEEFKPQALSAYEVHQKQSVHAFLRSLAGNPGEFKAGIRQ